MWTCPKCKRSFKRRDQQHSCVLISKENIFAKRPPELKQLYEVLVKKIKSLGDYKEESIPPDVIFFKTKSTFLAVKVKKSFLEVEFFLDHHKDSPVVSKFLQTSKHRFVHVVHVDRKEDLNKQLFNWIEHSYQLVLS